MVAKIGSIVVAVFFLYKIIFILCVKFRTNSIIQNKSTKKYKKNMKTIVENKNYQLNKEGDILEYSRNESVQHGLRNSAGEIQLKFKRPVELKRKGITQIGEVQLEKRKVMNRKYANAIKKWIPLKDLYKYENCKNISIRVFVDTTDDTNAIIRDDSAVYKINLKRVVIAGEFYIINLDKLGDDIKVNYIMKDN